MIARGLAALAAVLALAAVPVAAQRMSEPAITDVQARELPREAHDTLELIRKRGPYPYAKDHAVFGNREARLPRKKYGYYHEYTVKTPGERTRGARRIVAGREGELYYSPDHYNTFRRIRE